MEENTKCKESFGNGCFSRTGKDMATLAIGKKTESDREQLCQGLIGHNFKEEQRNHWCEMDNDTNTNLGATITCLVFFYVIQSICLK